MTVRIAAVLDKRFPNNKIAPTHYGALLTEYLASGLATPHLVEELETGDEGKLWSYVWEAMLYRHLHAAGYELYGTASTSGQHGPDFCAKVDGKTIWLEATVPSPDGIPAEYLESLIPGEIKVKSKPDKEQVLRCTSVIADKQKKLLEYRKKGIIGETDCTVIALNICRLSDWDIDGMGISQLPLSVEAVFPLGPLSVPISRDGKIAGEARHSLRFTVRKATGASVSTSNFLDPAFSNVSAVIQGHQKDMHQKSLGLIAIHNPTATNGLPLGLFGLKKEYVAEKQGDHFELVDKIAS